MVSKLMTFRSIWRLALLISGCGAPATPRVIPSAAPIDLVVLGGDIRTMDPAHPHAQALAIAGGVIVDVGTSEAIAAKASATTRVIDARGATVTPGLIDAHCHLYGLGVDNDSVSVRALPSEAEAVRVAAAAAKDRPAGEWLLGRGWDQNRWAGQQFPTKASLDAAISDRPVVLRRVDGHASWVNSKALAAANITKATKDPAGGTIVRDAKGEPTGVLVDNASELVEAVMPVATPEVRERRIRAAAQQAVAAGITGVHEMGIEDATADVYAKLAAGKQLPLRVYAFLAGDPAHLERLAAPPRPATGRFVMRGVKFFADGALGSRGARLAEPYVDDPKNRGLWVTEPRLLAASVETAVAHDWQVAIHAIGDAGVTSVLDAYLAAERAHPGDHRLRVEHTQIIAPADIARMVATHAIASMQPTHATSDMPWAEQRVGAQRILGAYAWRTMLDNRIPLAAGSDFPVEEVAPLLGIYAAVTRQDASGNPAGGWYPKQKLTLDEAIAAFTTGAAYAEGAEATRGMIAVGRAADVTIFDRPLAADRSLLETRVAFTIVEGEVVFDRGAAK